MAMEKSNGRFFSVRHILIFGLVAVGAALAWMMSSYVSLERVQALRGSLKELVEVHYGPAVTLYILFYVLQTVLSVPSAAVMTVLGGYLFGLIPGFIYTVFAATLGAIGAFVFTRFILGRFLQNRYREQLASFNKSVDSYGVFFLLAARLIAIIPFSLINILAGMTRIPTGTFALTTAIGIIPGTFLYTYTGMHLSQISSLPALFSPPFIIVSALLALLAIAPVLWAWYKGSSRGSSPIRRRPAKR